MLQLHQSNICPQRWHSFMTHPIPVRMFQKWWTDQHHWQLVITLVIVSADFSLRGLEMTLKCPEQEVSGGLTGFTWHGRALFFLSKFYSSSQATKDIFWLSMVQRNSNVGISVSTLWGLPAWKEMSMSGDGLYYHNSFFALDYGKLTIPVASAHPFWEPTFCSTAWGRNQGYSVLHLASH